MRVLVACEYSARVRDAFRAMGHDAWSCDLLPSEGDPRWHYQGDVLEVIDDEWWDLMIAHPPCTYLTNAGSLHLYEGECVNAERWREMEAGAEFFNRLLHADIEHICVENPIMHGHARKLVGQKWTQSIQPWMFGHTEQKRSCLWLKNLPLLKPTKRVYWETMLLPAKERAKVHHAQPGPDRWKERSRTLPGIANAMAEQWGGQFSLASL